MSKPQRIATRHWPNSPEAETSVIGACLLSEGVIDEVAAIVRSDMFFDDRKRRIFEAIVRLRTSGVTPDLVTVVTELRKSTDAPEVAEYPQYIAAISRDVPTPENALQYARIVWEHWARRQVMQVGSRLSEGATDTSADVFDAISEAESTLMSLTESASAGRGARDMATILRETLVQIQESRQRFENGETIQGIPTGSRDVDRRYNGWRESELTILAARPSTGKTTLALQWAINATRAGYPVLFHSLEMGDRQLVRRVLSRETKVPVSHLLRGELKESDVDILLNASQIISPLPLYVDESPALDVYEIWRRARVAVRRHGIKLLIVDYLQLTTSSHAKGRTEEVSDVARGLKNIAKDLGISVLALSQLNRSVEGRNSRRPRLSDLRESGEIEAAADVVMGLYRPSLYEDDPNNWTEDSRRRPDSYTELVALKFRDGAIGHDVLHFRGDLMTFYDESHSEPPQVHHVGSADDEEVF